MYKNHAGNRHVRQKATEEKQELEKVAETALTVFQRFFTKLTKTYVPSWKGLIIIAVVVFIEMIFLTISRNLAEQQVAPTNQITNQARIAYQDAVGQSYGPISSNIVTVDLLPLPTLLPSPSPTPPPAGGSTPTPTILPTPLVVTAAPILVGDTTPPEQITSLVVDAVTNNTISVSWKAPGDDGILGTASSYDLRISDKEINTSDQSSWNRATSVMNEPIPLPVGTTQTYIFSSLTPNVSYWIAIAAADEVGNVSPFSNVVSAFPTKRRKTKT